MSAEQRGVIQNALNETFSTEIHVRFETAPELVSGIELTTNGQKVAWTIADYLTALEQSVDDLLKAKDKAEAKSETPSDLAPEIGKRAYELYEEQGRKDGRAVQDWEKAEREIRMRILQPVNAEPQPEAKSKPGENAKAVLETEGKVEPKPQIEPETCSKVETKPEETEPEAQSR